MATGKEVSVPLADCLADFGKVYQEHVEEG